jgi:hypothetical protein
MANHSAASFDLLVSQCERLLKEKFVKNKFDLNRKNIKIGIVGGGIGGCSTAYFLGDILCKDESINLEIDIYERESDIGGNFSSKFEYNNSEYDLNSVKINFSQIYMKYFHDACGKLDY